jgi:hypothetical protein
LKLGEGGAQGEPLLGVLGAGLDRGAVEIGVLGGQLGLAAAAAELVERRVAGDPEEPGARLAAPRIEAAALAVARSKAVAVTSSAAGPSCSRLAT